jgi:anti-sigma factor ChrR (cupin superfamily)
MNDIVWTSAPEAPAQEIYKGVHIHRLWKGENGAAALIVEIAPGAGWEELDVHEPGPEEVFVVAGTFNDGVRDYAPGTFIHNPAGSSHVPQSKTGCTLFVFFPEG